MVIQDLRVGQGIDLHRFESGRKLMLGGVHIPGHDGLLGHSDADVLLHAICDALLGAAGLPDIGVIFPNTDPKWRDVSSVVFLREVGQRVFDLGWRVGNLDCSLIAEKPKLAPFVPAMKQLISSELKIESVQCGIKATTPEGMGALGREEGILAFASVLLIK